MYKEFKYTPCREWIEGVRVAGWEAEAGGLKLEAGAGGLDATTYAIRKSQLQKAMVDPLVQKGCPTY